MFGTVLTTSITLMHVYVFWRAASVPFVQRLLPRWGLLSLALLLWLMFFAGREYGHGGTGELAGSLELLGMNWMAVIFLTAIPLLAVDLASGFGFFFRDLAPSLRGTALAAGLLMSATAVVQGMRPPVVREYEVHLDALPASLDGTKLVALSDLHLGSLIGGDWLGARVDQVNSLKPDAVLLLGDLFEGHGFERGEVLPELERFSAPMGVWAVLGNHEFYGGQDRAVALLEGAGIRVLRNSVTNLGDGLLLAGVDYYSHRRSPERARGVLEDFVTREEDRATVLLSHAPVNAGKAARAGAGLMLSGHTHGGQIWPFGYLVKRAYPLLGGRYEVDGMTVLVCRGTGTWGPRMRLWRAGEILEVTLRAGDG